jgi:hypothetical protein
LKFLFCDMKEEVLRNTAQVAKVGWELKFYIIDISEVLWNTAQKAKVGSELKF